MWTILHGERSVFIVEMDSTCITLLFFSHSVVVAMLLEIRYVIERQMGVGTKRYFWAGRMMCVCVRTENVEHGERI